MALNTKGVLLEGMRVSNRNSSYTFPPRNFIQDGTALNSAINSTEYLLIAASNNVNDFSSDIANPDFKFDWTKNEGDVIRFDYDNYTSRWSPLPGGLIDQLGDLSNTNRLAIKVPDDSVSDAPYVIFLGYPTRIKKFKIEFVAADNSFSNPDILAYGTVEVSKESGKLNFSSLDVSQYEGNQVYSQRQSFFDRKMSTGRIGDLPSSSSSDYDLFLNPLPASGQKPRLRIGYQRYLTPIQVPSDSVLGNPPSGTFTWSLSTGKIKLSSVDVTSNYNQSVYYDGVILDSVSFTKTQLGALVTGYPNSSFTNQLFVNLNDPKRYALFVEGSYRSYFTIILISGFPLDEPSPGDVIIDKVSGSVYFSPEDLFRFNNWTVSVIDTIITIENGVSIQFYRSGANSHGIPTTPDFVIQYQVNNQLLNNSIMAMPFFMLPTVPIVDSNLKYEVAKYVNSPLVNNIDNQQLGIGYLTNFDQHQLLFSNRKKLSFILEKRSSSIKLPDNAVSKFGFEVYRNQTKLLEGTDFEFDSTTGLIDFVKTVGQNDKGNIYNKNGKVELPNILTVKTALFSQTNVGQYILIESGPNQGLYKIIHFINSTKILVNPDFKSAINVVFDIRKTAEIVSDKIWENLDPLIRNFSLSTATDRPISGHDREFSLVANTEYSVFANTGQVNLNNPARSWQTYQATYQAIEKLDDGTTQKVNKIDVSTFKVRQETVLTTVGSKNAEFNSNGKTVNESKGFTFYLNGVTQNSDYAEFVPPGGLKLSKAIEAGQRLVIDYWVEEANGGETNFSLTSTDIDIDFVKITNGVNLLTVGGDQTNRLHIGSGLLFNRTEMLIIKTVSYDANQDLTIMTFESTPAFDFTGSQFAVSSQIESSYREKEQNTVNVIIKGTSYVYIQANSVSDYEFGTIITIDSDPYIVTTSLYDESNGLTKLTLLAPIKRDYLIPILYRTVRPILFYATRFKTKYSAKIDLPFTLIKMGDDRKVLVKDVDYIVSYGGEISLAEHLKLGDTLYCLYIAQSYQMIGTTIDVNYAYQIVPDNSNGLFGSRLYSSYNLYSPDNFYYRIVTVGDYITEVFNYVKQSGSQSTTVGPNVTDATPTQTKDFGLPTPYFNEQYYNNIDIVISNLLLYYNDLINQYEDVVSNLNGSVIGGNSGRFRFDGKTNNPVRTSYSEITNDIDDKVVLYYHSYLTDFFSFTTEPVYGLMADPNPLSRLFPTSFTKSVAINDLISTSDNGAVIGSTGVTNIISATTTTSTKANQFITEVDGTGTIITVASNGTSRQLIPQFVVGQDVGIYTLDGVLNVSAKILSADTNQPSKITIDTPTSLKSGSILQNVTDTSNPLNHFYVSGRDFVLDPTSGQLINNYTGSSLQVPIVGNEIIDIPLVVSNSDTAPKSIPALFGSELNDDGRVPAPRLKRINEKQLITDELMVFSTIGNAKVNADLVTISSSTISVNINDIIKFTNGPNNGLSRSVSTVINQVTFIVSSPLISIDLTGSDFQITSSQVNINDALQNEINVISQNSASFNPPSPLSTINSELKSINSIIMNYGDVIVSSAGATTSNTLTDNNVNFNNLDVIPGYLLFISSGQNYGLYLITQVTDNDITVSTSSPYYGFPSIMLTNYIILSPYQFIGSQHHEFATQFLKETVAFLSSTTNFKSNPTESNKHQRLIDIQNRQVKVNNYISTINNLIKNDNLRGIRYIWIDQRVNKKYGTLTRKVQAELKRQTDSVQIVSSQQKSLMFGNFSV